MTSPTTSEATANGVICAVAGQSQRQLREWAAAHSELYSAEVFDSALFSTLALAAAFSGPWYTADQLRMANKACLWCFGLDWLVDYAASSAAEVGQIADRCEAVAAGAPPAKGDALAGLLAEIRDELAAAPSFPALREIWLDELRRMLTAMAREWDWKAARDAGDVAEPTLDRYLGNADNLGFSFVFTAHWISTGRAGTEASAAALRAASRRAQRVIRLHNDLGTRERDLKWGDLNGLLLDATREQVMQRIDEETAQARVLIAAARPDHPRLADYMERQMDFCAGFYGVTDFWGPA